MLSNLLHRPIIHFWLCFCLSNFNSGHILCISKLFVCPEKEWGLNYPINCCHLLHSLQQSDRTCTRFILQNPGCYKLCYPLQATLWCWIIFSAHLLTDTWDLLSSTLNIIIDCFNNIDRVLQIIVQYMRRRYRSQLSRFCSIAWFNLSLVHS